MLILLSTTLFSADIYMRNGKVWKNVSLLKAKETPQRIAIWTTSQGTIVLKKKDLHGIIEGEFDKEAQSQLEKFEGSFPANLIRYESSIQAGKSISEYDSLMLTLPKNRYSFSGGYGKYASELNSTDDDLANDLKNGYNMMLNIANFPSGKLGVNISASRLFSSAGLENIQDSNSGVLFDIESQLSITYIGIGALQRVYGKKSGFVGVFGATLGAGNISLNGSADALDGSSRDKSELDITGFGGQAIVSVEKLVNESISIGGSFTFTTLRFKSVKIDGRSRELFEADYIKHLTLNIGLQIYR